MFLSEHECAPKVRVLLISSRNKLYNKIITGKFNHSNIKAQLQVHVLIKYFLQLPCPSTFSTQPS